MMEEIFPGSGSAPYKVLLSLDKEYLDFNPISKDCFFMILVEGIYPCQITVELLYRVFWF